MFAMTTRQREVFLSDLHVGVISIPRKAIAPAGGPIQSVRPDRDFAIQIRQCRGADHRHRGVRSRPGSLVPMRPERWLTADFTKVGASS